MQSNSAPAAPENVKGWIFDVYPTAVGEVAVWIIVENGKRIRLTDQFQPKVYVSGKQDEIERLASRFFSSSLIASWDFVYKYAHPTDAEKSRVLEVTLTDCRRTSSFTRSILEIGDYLKYEVHNCDLHGDRAYLFSRDLFPLALVEVEADSLGLRYTLLDSVESLNYDISPMRIMELQMKIAKTGKIANFKDPVERITVTQ